MRLLLAVFAIFTGAGLFSEEAVNPERADQEIDIISGVEEDQQAEAGQMTKEKIYEVKVSEEDAKVIDEIITTMGTSSVLSLGFKRSHLKALGQKIHGIGSLQFLGYIVAHEDLKQNMKKIHESTFKWRGFMDGLKPGLDKEVDKDTIFAEIPAFAKLVGADAAKLSELAKQRKWEEFVQEAVMPKA